MRNAGETAPQVEMIEWKDEYRTGLSSVDYEHEILINSINILCGLAAVDDNDEAAVALNRIFTLVEVHFVLEEKIMRDRNYSGYTDHKHDHDLLLDAITKIMDEVKDGDPAIIMPRLAKSAAEWFDNHLVTHDRAMYSHL